MSDINFTYNTGIVKSTPEINKTKQGEAIGNFPLLIIEYHTTKTDQLKKCAYIVEVEITGSIALWCQTNLRNGDQVMVLGRLVQDNWTTPDGEARQKIKIRALRLHKIA